MFHPTTGAVLRIFLCHDMRWHYPTATATAAAAAETFLAGGGEEDIPAGCASEPTDKRGTEEEREGGFGSEEERAMHWEHAKFAFRTAAFVGVTVQDHLIDLHFKTANMLVHGTGVGSSSHTPTLTQR